MNLKKVFKAITVPLIDTNFLYILKPNETNGKAIS